MIRIRNISKTYNKGTAGEAVALRDVSLDIATGEYVMLLGSNGSGKSTLLNAIAGSLIPDEGTVSINDTDVTRIPEYGRSKWISRVFQDPLAGTAPDLSVVDNFRLAALRTSSKGLKLGVDAAFRAKVKEQLAILGMGLEEKLMMPVGSLSGGQRQAITLLMAAMDDSGVMLLDEPTAALDPKTAEQVMRLADRLIRERKLTAVLVTHNLRQATEYGSRLIRMQEGRIAQDLNAEAKAAVTLNELYSWF